MSRFDAEGIFPPIPTPFEDQKVALDRLQTNIEKWDTSPLHGYVVLGSNGEFAHLTKNEKVEVWKKAAEATEKPIIAGAGDCSTFATVELIEEAAKAGAAACLVVSPYYYRTRMSPAVLRRHYLHLAEKAPVPLLLYNIPSFTTTNMSPELVGELSQHENIVGIKDSSGDVSQIYSYVNGTTEDFSVLSGSGSTLFAALCAGAQGGILALANVAPWKCVEIFDAYRDGRWEEAAETQAEMVPVNQAVTQRFSIPGVKTALDFLGYFGGKPRLPLEELTESQKDELRAILQEAGLVGC